MVGIATCGRPVRSAIALARPIVEPPPTATSPSTRSRATTAIAASVTSTGVCIRAPAKRAPARGPSRPAISSASPAWPGVESTSARATPSPSATSPTSPRRPGPNRTRILGEL